jgi:hypothetical protein
MSFRLRYSNFWPGFSAKNSLFTKILEKEIGKQNLIIVRNPSEIVDLEISSVFYFKNMINQVAKRIRAASDAKYLHEYLARTGRGFSLNPPKKTKRLIWYTGENKRFPLHGYDGSISFDPTDKKLNNLFFPYWMIRIPWLGMNPEYELSLTTEELLVERKPQKREISACSFSNLKESNRERTVHAVRNIVQVQEFGSAHGNFVKSKFHTSQEYGLQVCTENDLYPNYVTEKLIESWAAHNIPIWSGLDTDGWFNENAIIDVTNKTTEEIEERIRSLTKDELMYMQSQPILKKRPYLNELTEFLLMQLDK